MGGKALCLLRPLSVLAAIAACLNLALVRLWLCRTNPIENRAGIKPTAKIASASNTFLPFKYKMTLRFLSLPSSVKIEKILHLAFKVNYLKIACLFHWVLLLLHLNFFHPWVTKLLKSPSQNLKSKIVWF